MVKNIKIKVHANSSQEKIFQLSDKEFEVWIKEKPIEGRANSYIEKFLKKEAGFSCKIIRGLRSKNKVAEVLEI